jgi:hypothetical protein
VLEVINNLPWLVGEMDCQPPRHCKQQGKNNAVVNNKEKTMPFQLGQKRKLAEKCDNRITPSVTIDSTRTLVTMA